MTDTAAKFSEYAHPEKLVSTQWVADHVGGLSSWAYWLGWVTGAPINAFLAALYIVDLFNIDFGGSFGPIGARDFQRGRSQAWAAVDRAAQVRRLSCPKCRRQW